MKRLLGSFVGKYPFTVVSFVLFCAFGSASYFAYCKYRSVAPPSPEYIDISAFKGRIVFASKVQPGTFGLWTDYEAVNGRDAIMSVGYSYTNPYTVVLQVWKPDETTSGVFKMAQKEISCEKWHVQKGWLSPEFLPSIKAIELEKGRIRVDTVVGPTWPPMIVVGVICTFVASLMLFGRLFFAFLDGNFPGKRL